MALPSGTDIGLCLSCDMFQEKIHMRKTWTWLAPVLSYFVEQEVRGILLFYCAYKLSTQEVQHFERTKKIPQLLFSGHISFSEWQ